MNQLIEDLDRACPGFVPYPGEVGLDYMWIGSFVRHVVRARLDGREDEVRAVFALIEEAIAQNGPNKNLAIVGFLEDMQNGNLHADGSRPNDFIAYLGPHSAKAWDGLNGFWQAVEHNKKMSPPG